MLKFSRFHLLLILSLIFVSCSKDSEPNEETPQPEEPLIEDEFQYIALRNDGKLFTIGDQSGVVELAGNIPGLEFNTIFNTVTSSSENTYIYESWFDPPQPRLFIRNRETGNSEMIELDFPEEFGSVPGFMSLDWDERQNNLVGIIRHEFDSPTMNKPIKIARLDPDTYNILVLEDIDLNTLGYQNVFSSQLINQKIYVSASKNSRVSDADLLEVDLSNKTIKVLSQENIETGLMNLAAIPNTNKLLGFAPLLNSGYGGAVKPYIYDIGSESLEELASIPRISAIHFAHKTFVNPYNDKIISLIGQNGLNLFSYDYYSNDFNITPIANPEDLSSMIAIIDVIKL
ncbi:hypothetical protein [Christiangramia sediminis]|uniref:Uncharacterized protein n=1 Tax=Christiangramia sediminis TaxID=2881336 RepID=A0A9X1LHQ1_9FLAO|nr:hypothetical protein [Christiangramia sediminis]MCB7480540.1 hypothetical protein [Christiangramia sediminis]